MVVVWRMKRARGASARVQDPAKRARSADDEAGAEEERLEAAILEMCTLRGALKTC